MRRLLILILACAVFLFALPVLAQTPQVTPEPTLPGDAATISAADAVRAETAASAAEADMNDAERYAGDASRFASLFEVFSFGLGAIGTILSVLGAANLISDRRERKEQRQLFIDEIASQKREVESLRQQLADSAHQQHKNAENATLAMAVLPLGDRQYKAQDLKGAADTYNRALTFDEDNPVIHYRLGYVYVQSGALQDAETQLKRSLEIDPDFVMATAALGYVYRRMGDQMSPGVDRNRMHNKAEANLLDALKRSPRLVDEDGESWWGSLGGLYRRRGQVDDAINAYDQAASVTPHSSYPFSNLALLYMAKHDRERMLKMYEHVEHLARGEATAEVDNFWAYADVLTSLLALGKTSEAGAALESAFAIAPPDSPYALESLADTLTRLLDALGGTTAAPYLQPYIDRVLAHSKKPSP